MNRRQKQIQRSTKVAIIDPVTFAKEDLKPIVTENGLFCRPVDLAESVHVLGTAANFLMAVNAGAFLNALVVLLKSFDESCLTVWVEKDSVKYVVTVKPR